MAGALFVSIMLVPLYVLYKVAGRLKWIEVTKFYSLLLTERENDKKER